MLSKALNAIRKAFTEHQEKQFLKSNSASELVDCGVSQSAFLTTLGAPPDTRARMASMATHYGLPASAIADNHHRSLKMARVCAQCGERPLCAKWLGDASSGPAPNAFCPNAKDWEMIEKERR